MLTLLVAALAGRPPENRIKSERFSPGFISNKASFLTVPVNSTVERRLGINTISLLARRTSPSRFPEVI